MGKLKIGKSQRNGVTLNSEPPTGTGSGAGNPSLRVVLLITFLYVLYILKSDSKPIDSDGKNTKDDFFWDSASTLPSNSTVETCLKGQIVTVDCITESPQKFFPDLKDCRRFYICSNDTILSFNCFGKTLYNWHLHACCYPPQLGYYRKNDQECVSYCDQLQLKSKLESTQQQSQSQSQSQPQTQSEPEPEPNPPMEGQAQGQGQSMAQDATMMSGKLLRFY